MKITVAAIGKVKANSAEMQLAENYLKRLPWECQFKEIEEKRNLPAEKLKEREAELLCSLVPDSAVKIVLDEHGKQYDSVAFSQMLSNFQEDGRANIGFFIGGAYGHGIALKKQADITISLGKMTWPHVMVRTMLAEQIYRAYTISSGHPYHKI